MLHTPSSIRPLSLGLAMLALTACDGAPGGGAEGAEDDGSTSSSTAEARPGCKPILLCATLCGGDAACVEGCKAGATADGLAAFEAMTACGGAAGCQDQQCTFQQCPDEFQACQDSIGVGGFVCYSEGWYNECDTSGACALKSAIGAAWGASVDQATANADADCTLFMNDLIAIAFVNGSAEVNQSCQAYECQPYP